jgi:hypothetical protein
MLLMTQGQYSNNYYLNTLLEKMNTRNKKGGELIKRRREREIITRNQNQKTEEGQEKKTEKKMIGGGKITIEAINAAIQYTNNPVNLIQFDINNGFQTIILNNNIDNPIIKHCNKMIVGVQNIKIG